MAGLCRCRAVWVLGAGAGIGRCAGWLSWGLCAGAGAVGPVVGCLLVMPLSWRGSSPLPGGSCEVKCEALCDVAVKGVEGFVDFDAVDAMLASVSIE